MPRRTTTLLASMTHNGLNLSHQFHYGANQAGELTGVTLPYGGKIEWAYRDFTYTGNRTLREVEERYLTPSAGDAALTWEIARNDASDAGMTIHGYGELRDPSGDSAKRWVFDTNTASDSFGLPLELREQSMPGNVDLAVTASTWARHGTSGQRYVASVGKTIDVGGSAKTSKSETDIDEYGNVVATRLYNYGDLVNPARTYTSTYWHNHWFYVRVR